HTLRVQGSTLRLELSEIKDIPTNSVRPRIQDPGAMTITFLVRDIDPIMAKAQQMHVEVVTPGGKAMNVTDSDGPARVIFVKDPTGYYVKLVQRNPAPASTAPATSNVLGGWMGITIKDTDETVKFYHDM